MSDIKKIGFVLLILFIPILSVLSQNDINDKSDRKALTGSYLGQKPPGQIPELFAKGIVSTSKDIHSSLVFSGDGKFVLWRVMNSGDDNGIYYMKLMNDIWTQPEKAPFIETEKNINNDVPIFFPNDSTIFFISDRNDKGIKKKKIWFIKKNNGAWGKPERFQEFDPHDISVHWQFSFTNTGNIYFTGISKNGFGQYDIFKANKENGKYIITPLPIPVNSELSDICPFIAPDESYLIFSSDNRQNGYGEHDLYICYKNIDGCWTNPINMGAKINSAKHDWCPNVTKDGKYLFFTSFRNGNCNAYWISAKIIEELKPLNLFNND